ncbi:hypothetical protein TNIN_239571 [Trichonephila inaurata madagascariensis]|uniref:Uncharacterized protein n=1 Tax=Trichonephila inaurata madagascariensis TaxID=2747483 RepID=A0A8X7BS47_9ARAC|nr:hypothetical protein TNIN_239571 [Trichonephila inaurata madagascariensis]
MQMEWVQLSHLVVFSPGDEATNREGGCQFLFLPVKIFGFSKRNHLSRLFYCLSSEDHPPSGLSARFHLSMSPKKWYLSEEPLRKMFIAGKKENVEKVLANITSEISLSVVENILKVLDVTNTPKGFVLLSRKKKAKGFLF